MTVPSWKSCVPSGSRLTLNLPLWLDAHSESESPSIDDVNEGVLSARYVRGVKSKAYNWFSPVRVTGGSRDGAYETATQRSFARQTHLGARVASNLLVTPQEAVGIFSGGLGPVFSKL